MSDRWQFNEEDRWQEEQPAASGDAAAEEPVYGQDPEGIVAVYVTRTGEVIGAKLALDWKNRADPRALSNHVVAAANTATLNAATIQAQAAQAQIEQQTSGQPAEPARGSATSDESRITTEEALQLIEAVSSDVDAFMRQLDALPSTVSAESSGKHVRGTAQQGQIVEIVVDAGWASTARNAEIEGELTEVLKALQTKSSPGALANGPQSPAITQLREWASDPQQLLRRLGLT